MWAIINALNSDNFIAKVLWLRKSGLSNSDVNLNAITVFETDKGQGHQLDRLIWYVQ